MNLINLLDYSNSIYNLKEKINNIKRKNDEFPTKASTTIKMLVMMFFTKKASVNSMMKAVHNSYTNQMGNIFYKKEFIPKTHAFRDCVNDIKHEDIKDIHINVLATLKKNKYFENTSEIMIEKYDYLLKWAKDTNLNAIWSKAFRKCSFMWNSSQEKDLVKSGEDLMMNIPLIRNANIITYIPENLYFYRSNNEGVSSKFHESKVKDLIISRSEFHDYLESFNSFEINKNVSISTFTLIAGTVSALLQADISNKEQLLSLLVESELYRRLDKTTICKVDSFHLIILLKLLNRRCFVTLELFEKMVCLITKSRR